MRQKYHWHDRMKGRRFSDEVEAINAKVMSRTWEIVEENRDTMSFNPTIVRQMLWRGSRSKFNTRRYVLWGDQ